MSHKHIIPVTPEERLQRAISASAKGYYKLGKGGRRPENDSPFHVSEGGQLQCDCSGFANWVAGYDRFQLCDPEDAPEDLWDKSNGGFWMDTSGIIADATRDEPIWWKALTRTDDIALGDFVVFGDADGNQGHIAVVADLLPGFAKARKSRQGWGSKLGVIDCSPRRPNGYRGADGKTYYRRDAVQVRPDMGRIFEKVGRSYFVRPIRG